MAKKKSPNDKGNQEIGSETTKEEPTNTHIPISNETGSSSKGKKVKDEEIKQDNTELKEVLKRITGTMVFQIVGVIVTFLVAVFTLLVAIYTAQNSKSTSETAKHIDKMARSTIEVVSKAAEMAQATADIARSTAEIARRTAEVADYARQLINPILTIYCSIKSDFECTVDDGFSFKANQYLWKQQSQKETNFYIAVKNDSTRNIRGELKNVGFKVSVVNMDNEVLQSNTYFQKIPLQHLGPSEITGIIEADEFERQLKEDFNWRGLSDRIIKIEIDKMGVKVPDYPYAGVNVMYLEYEEFKKLHEKLKNVKNKGI